jgi:hypothetical protein
MLVWLIPIAFCGYGCFFTFFRFWNGFDAISGDVGDARFNAMVLEHTWLWLKGIHSSLFNTPMFYPHPNVYAYSDYLFGVAPLYWIARFFHVDPYLSYQWWLIACCILNFVAFFILARKFFKFSPVFSSLGAYVFTFSLPRISHFEHGQLAPQFYIVLSAMGALLWWREPQSKKAAGLFVLGASLQFLTSFYYFWFWVWTLAVYAFYVLVKRERREQFKFWFQEATAEAGWKYFLGIALAGFLMIAPFLYHYLLVAKEVGMRGWVSVSNSTPRFYSWLNLPHDHWEWSLVPFQPWINALPVPQEHLLSFGLLTWLCMLAAAIWAWKSKTKRYLVIPLVAMFLFTLTSGRFSTWVFVTYLFPAGGAIRAVGRIQIFMLLFWALIFIFFLKNLWDSPRKIFRATAIFTGLFFFAENTYSTNWVFSRAQDEAKVSRVIARLPGDCEVLVYTDGLRDHADFENMDAIVIAFLSGRATVNGYSGNQPPHFGDLLYHETPATLDDALQRWFRVHSNGSAFKTCKIGAN